MTINHKFFNLWDSAAEKLSRKSDLALMAILFLTAMVFRSYASFTSIAHIYPDEIFQTVEMGHLAAFGKGFKFWEFRVGARSWVFPGIIAGMYKFIAMLGVEDPLYLNAGLKLCFSLIHAIGFIFLFKMLKGWVGKVSAFLVTLTAASHFMGCYIAVRTLSEAFCFPFMIASIYFADRHLKKDKVSDIFFCAFSAGLAYMIRYQTIVFCGGVGLSLLFLSKKRMKTVSLFAVFGIGMILLQGLIDYLTWGKFMKSIITYIDYNVFRGVASKHGVSPYHFYFKSIVMELLPFTAISGLICAAHLLRKKRESLIVLPMLCFFILHIATPHKESRFVYPVYMTLIILAPLAFVYLSKIVREKYRNTTIFLSMILVLIFSTMGAAQFTKKWNTTPYEIDSRENKRRKKGYLMVSVELGRIPEIQSALVIGLQKLFSGGYAYFHRKVPIRYEKNISTGGTLVKRAIIKGNRESYVAFVDGQERHYRSSLSQLDFHKKGDGFVIYKVREISSPHKVKIAALSKRKKNRTKWDKSGNIVMGKRGIEISIGELSHVEKLEVSLDSGDIYQLSFIQNGKEIDSIKTKPYNHYGLHVHTLNVPKKATSEGFDAIVVKPIKGDSAYSIGHLLLKK